MVGTAGHVDHGKSTLVQSLTGTNPDRLAEELRRGMTIDLGFAHVDLGEVVAAFVDVPGHAGFIRNTLAGVGSVRAALLVVAADEGPMPQTLEHLAILDLLDVRFGVVAITKADLAEGEEWLELVRRDVAALLAPTSMAGAPIVLVSASTGEGLDELRVALAAELARAGAPVDHGRGRMAVDRVFSRPGYGTVVTGTLRGGSVAVGDELVVSPSGKSLRVRGVQSYGQELERAACDSRVALNVTGAGADDLERGHWLYRPGDYPVSRLMDVEVTLLETAGQPLRHDDRLNVYHGSAQIEARFRLLGSAPIAPGEHGVGQLVLATPELAAADDRMVLRRASAAATVGGARVLDPSPIRLHRRHRAETSERFELLLDGSPSARVLAAIAHRQPCAAADLSPAVVGAERGDLPSVLTALQNEGAIAPLGVLWMTAAGRVALDERALAALRDHHARHPMLGGPPREELRARLGLDRGAFQIWLDAAVAAGLVGVEGALVRLAIHRPEEEPGFQTRTGALLARFRADPYDPPSIADVRAGGEADSLRALLERGDLVQLTSALALDARAYARAKEEVIRILDARGQVTVVDVRDTLSTSRRVTLAILEQMDRERLTVRTGDVRIPGSGLRRAPKAT